MAGTDVDVAVVGAGLAGLATALDLTAANLTVVVFERGDRPGWPRRHRIAWTGSPSTAVSRC